MPVPHIRGFQLINLRVDADDGADEILERRVVRVRRVLRRPAHVIADPIGRDARSAWLIASTASALHFLNAGRPSAGT
jgi:hypothetical protein